MPPAPTFVVGHTLPDLVGGENLRGGYRQTEAALSTYAVKLGESRFCVVEQAKGVAANRTPYGHTYSDFVGRVSLGGASR